MKVISRKRGLFQTRSPSCRGEEGFLSCSLPHLPLGVESGPCGRLLWVDPKMPDCLVKIHIGERGRETGNYN